MSEKMPSGNEEGVDQSRRGFLKGLGALGAAAAVGGTAYLASRKDEGQSAPEHLQVEAPYDTAVSELSREQAMKEIVHDKAAILRLETFLSEGFPSAAATQPSPEDIDVMYFLARYPDPKFPPSKQDIEIEIESLRTRITLLEARRDQPVE